MIERFEELLFQPFEFHGFLRKCGVVSFSWCYEFSGRTLRNSNPISGLFSILSFTVGYGGMSLWAAARSRQFDVNINLMTRNDAF
jgi:hypothetical protein